MKSSASATSEAPRRARRGFNLLAAVWTGSLLAIGWLAAPILFATLERAAAGAVAARLFAAEAWCGVVCAALLGVLSTRLIGRGAAEYRLLHRIVAAMFVCVVLGYFALEPAMSTLRAAAAAAGTDVGHSAYAARFGVLHGVSTAFYVVESVLALALIWRLPVGP